jgi:glycosyltransferase involved in cell wall biosynthesis
MKLLICTQAVDQDDPALGFFHEWIAKLAPRFDSIEVICLREGRHTLPANVSVHSLGKESSRSRLKYVSRFYRYVIGLAGSYDAVFVHQNQEYVLLAGWLWKLMGKRVYLWRNHYAGSFLTDIAAAFCDKVFCTSKHSYTAKYKKTMLMPVGVDTDLFRSDAGKRIPCSILFLGRITPSKHPDILIEALGMLEKEGTEFTATICGPTLAKDETYLASLKQRVSELKLDEKVTFKGGVSHGETPALYASHDIFVNLAESGMYDKTLFEAAASGTLVVASSRDYTKLVGDTFAFDDSAASLAHTLEALLDTSETNRQTYAIQLRHLAEEGHSFTKLMTSLARVLRAY